MVRPLPVSILARFAADPDGFRSRQRPSKTAVRHGIRWHERLAATPTTTRLWPWVVLGLLAAGAAFAFIVG